MSTVKQALKAARDLFFGINTGKICWWCETPLGEEGRWGIHKECEFAGVAGHLVKCCTCCPPPDGRGQWENDREMALEAWRRRGQLNDS